ncbi:MAG: endonuclease/exonuclease/phosphatase family protein, partial [Pseudomonadota bacterium]
MHNKRVVFYANVNGMRARADELRRAAQPFDIVALQETRLRSDVEAAALFRTIFPQHIVAASFPHNEDGAGCALLVRAGLPFRVSLRMSTDRHRLLGVEVDLPGCPSLSVATLYVPPRGSVGGYRLRPDLLETALSPQRALLVGDLNARSAALGCQSTNTNGRTLERFLDSSGALVINDPGIPTFLHSSRAFEDCLDWGLATPSAAAFLSCAVGADIGSDHLPLLIAGPP